MFDFKRATVVQRILKDKVSIASFEGPVSYVAGCDLTFLNPFKTPTMGIASFVVLKYPEIDVVEKVWVSGKVDIPYVPGFLGFREIPLLLKAYAKLSQRPDVTIVDGHGITHPRGLGVASHFGVVLGIPTIGCAKKPLYGKFEIPGMEKGDFSFIYDDVGEKIGVVLRTKTGVKPVYISPGHLINVESALEIVKNLVVSYKLPEPTRMAHNFLQEVRKHIRAEIKE